MSSDKLSDADHERVGLLDALIAAIERRDETVAILASTDSRTAAVSALTAAFKVEELYAIAILDLQLWRLLPDSLDRLRAERAELAARLAGP